MAFRLTTFLSGISHVRGLKQSQRAWSAPSFKFFDRVCQRYKTGCMSKRIVQATCLVCTVIAFSLTVFISGISRLRGLKQSSNSSNVPDLHPPFKLFDQVYKRYKPGYRSQRIVQATCLVCTVHGIQFDLVYQRYKPRARSETILTCLV